MCGRFTSLLSPELLAAIYAVLPPEQLSPRYNISPTQSVLAVREEPSGGRYLSTVRWGFVPHWAKDISIGSKMINARAETVAEKPSFRTAFRQRRCIIPANGYYEWVQANDQKQPWYIKGHEDQPLSLAGLWEQWLSEDGSKLETCAIITTAANELTVPIHDRMPLILPKQSISPWLDKNTSPGDLVGMLIPCSPEMLEAYTVSNLVNNSRFDSPSCIARV